MRPEFGPSLFQLLGPRVRRLPRAAQAALALAAAAVAALLLWLALGGASKAPPTAVVRKPVAFNLVYAPGVRRTAPQGREVLRLGSKPGTPAPVSFAVSPLDLPVYRGDVSAQLTFMSVGLIDRMRATIPGFVWRGDGRVNVNKQPGYQIVYQARIGGRTVYGKRVLLVPGYDPPPRQGLDITMQAMRSGQVPSADSVGLNGALKTSYRSLRFGTERP
ncbi:MAG: hypothetical protein ACXVSX_11495 [Solirubrobacteraceae bacterium]